MGERADGTAPRIASIGECMVELSALGGDDFHLAFGGDTLNTAVYLARCGIGVDYVTALGDDHLSARMIASWRAEGVGIDHVLRLPGRLPGLYMIERDAQGERSFLYWRDRAPARDLFDATSDDFVAALARYEWIYFSGITLSLYGPRGRARFLAALRSARAQGVRIAFDGNYRARGWASAQAARASFDEALACVDLALPTFEDEQALYGDSDADACATRLLRAGVSEVVVKQGAAGCLVATRDNRAHAPCERLETVVDTTAAGDSFNAAYLAARLRGAASEAAARAGHRLARAVIGQRGAIIARTFMPEFSP